MRTSNAVHIKCYVDVNCCVCTSNNVVRVSCYVYVNSCERVKRCCPSQVRYVRQLLLYTRRPQLSTAVVLITAAAPVHVNHCGRQFFLSTSITVDVNSSCLRQSLWTSILPAHVNHCGRQFFLPTSITVDVNSSCLRQSLWTSILPAHVNHCGRQFFLPTSVVVYTSAAPVHVKDCVLQLLLFTPAVVSFKNTACKSPAVCTCNVVFMLSAAVCSSRYVPVSVCVTHCVSVSVVQCQSISHTIF